VPDLAHVIAQYRDGTLAADDFLDPLGVLYGNKDNAFKDRLSFLIDFPHRCMYDADRLVQIMNRLGFRAKRRAPFDSAIDDIDAIERERRTTNVLIVEGRKPSPHSEERTSQARTAQAESQTAS
jgi:hypothetical protein